MAIRIAIGADRGRLRGLVLTESLLIAGAAGWRPAREHLGCRDRQSSAAVSLELFAGSGTGWALTGDAVAVALDWRVLVFATVTTLTTGLLFGSIPALSDIGVSAHDVLRQMRTTGGVRAWTRKLLVVSQLAIAVILLIAAGLLLRSVVRLQRDRSGLRPDQRHHAAHRPVAADVSDPQDRRRFYDAVIERVRRLPGCRGGRLRDVSSADIRRAGRRCRDREQAGAGHASPVSARFRLVSHDYLRTLRVPLRAGRLFADADAAARPRWPW